MRCAFLILALVAFALLALLPGLRDRGPCVPLAATRFDAQTLTWYAADGRVVPDAPPTDAVPRCLP